MTTTTTTSTSDHRTTARTLVDNRAGITVSRRYGSVPAGGYVVGRAGLGLEASHYVHPDDMVTIVHRWLIDLPADVAYVGAWTDADTGRVYFDACYVVADRLRALMLAGATGELAIFDLAAGKEIRLQSPFTVAGFAVVEP